MRAGQYVYIRSGIVVLGIALMFRPGAARAECEDITSRVELEASRNTGRGACDGQIDARLTNYTYTRAVCHVYFGTRRGRPSAQMFGVSPGQTKHVWNCDGDGRVVYRCYAQPDWRRDMTCRN